MAENLENKKSETALREERILEFWKENKIFDKSLKQTEGEKEFIFYEGPPTANGKPGIHHLEARAFKDVIPRYKTMQGFHVRRKGGWDTQGLPVELQVEKKLGLNSKKGIEEYGIAKFNQECKESVWEYLEVWNKFTKRIGYWVDQKNAYVTYHNSYIESVWNIVKKINEQKLLYKDYKVVPWCPRCGTSLSSHELAQGYEDVKDLSVTVKFKVVASPQKNSEGGRFRPEGGVMPKNSSAATDDTYVLAWTTTPWTLPGNVALAVGEKLDYVKIKVGNEILILAKARLSIVEGEYEIIEEMKGKDLIGLEYEPLYPFLSNTIFETEKHKMEKAYKVYPADFVTTEDGTGVVHTAVMYGQDDFVLGTKVGLPKHHLVGLDGKFLAGTGIFEGRFVRDEEVAVDVIKDLAHRGLLFKKEKYEHSYPHCWRCHTALIYYARDSWYIKVSDPKIKEKMIAENKKINWEPSHIRDGRFGEWLREIKDWAISRERYWGTPLPVWACEKCKKLEVVGSVEELKQKTKKSGNKYFVMRHGEAENNVINIYSDELGVYPLTVKGRLETEKHAKELSSKKIAMIFASPLLRTKETAEIISDKIGFPKDEIIFRDELREFGFGNFSGKHGSEYNNYMTENGWDFDVKNPEGESFQDAKNRIGKFLYELEEKYKNENILIVSHGFSLEVAPAVVEGANKKRSEEIFDKECHDKTAELHKIDFIPIPHNENYELDLHRPYIDEVKLVCECGGNLVRTKEVMDVWLDSGAMPFAQDHYPFENKKWVDGAGYPADFISEAIDQTRGWFYTLHAVGVLMGRGLAYKNVICLGHLLDAKGKKMSKSLGNIVDPWSAMDKYGVDTLRLWMYSVNQPGESKNFDEKTVSLLHQQVFGLLYNVLAFYELYRDKSLEETHLTPSPLSKKLFGEGSGEKSNILDQWILARLNELVKLSTDNLNEYKLLEPTRAIRDFVGDLSTWYLRRSRERIKEGDKEAKQTLYFVLKTLAKVMAPFAPFSAEDIWLKLKNEKNKESVHLENWPKAEKVDREAIEKMAQARDSVSILLKERQQKNIPVRQVLSEATGPAVLGSYAEIIKEEINVKNYTGTGFYTLNTNMTPELKLEGNRREFIRALQDIRKEKNLIPSDIIIISGATGPAGENLIKSDEKSLMKALNAREIKVGPDGPTDGEEIKIDDLLFKVKIEKI